MMMMSGAQPKPRDLASLPKAELHLHLKGAMRPRTLRDLCRKYSIPAPSIPCYDSSDVPLPRSSTPRFADFSAFVDVYVAACACLRAEEDVRRLVLEVALDLRACNVLYAEVAPSLTFYSTHFGSMDNTLRVLVDAAAIAETETGVVLSYVLSVERHLGVEAAIELAHLARRGSEMEINGRAAVVGFGLHGPEESFPPRPFREAFEIACGDGKLSSLPHAGEIAPATGAGAGSVLDAVFVLGAKRVAHGVLARDDAEAMRALRERDVVLDVGITSNFLLNVVEKREDHPIIYFLEHGVKCTINSDDPLLFGCNILSEYQICRDLLGMDDHTISQCAKTSFEYSCAPEYLKCEGVAGVDQWLLEGVDG
jgi:adenosine deaminase